MMVSRIENRILIPSYPDLTEIEVKRQTAEITHFSGYHLTRKTPPRRRNVSVHLDRVVGLVARAYGPDAAAAVAAHLPVARRWGRRYYSLITTP